METLDAVVVGAGVVGLAVARALALAGREVIVLEAEDRPGQHASSRNSGVIHAGIYYPPGSLKARACVAGREALYRYCIERDIGHHRSGKLLVACRDSEVPRLRQLLDNARNSGVRDLLWLSREQCRELEPELVAVAGLLSPSTGIVDSQALLAGLLADLQSAGGQLVCRSPVIAGHAERGSLVLEVGGDDATRVACRSVVNCAGAQAPALAHVFGVAAEHVPPAYFVRGHWFELAGAAPFRHLVYPLPEPGGLGIHVTLDLGGRVRFGPDAQWIERPDYAFDASRITAFRQAIGRYYPNISKRELLPGQCGVRARISGPDEPLQDFHIDGPREHGVPGLVNLFGIESPGLTAALALADIVAAIPS